MRREGYCDFPVLEPRNHARKTTEENNVVDDVRLRYTPLLDAFQQIDAANVFAARARAQQFKFSFEPFREGLLRLYRVVHDGDVTARLLNPSVEVRMLPKRFLVNSIGRGERYKNYSNG